MFTTPWLYLQVSLSVEVLITPLIKFQETSTDLWCVQVYTSFLLGQKRWSLIVCDLAVRLLPIWECSLVFPPNENFGSIGFFVSSAVKSIVGYPKYISDCVECGSLRQNYCHLLDVGLGSPWSSVGLYLGIQIACFCGIVPLEVTLWCELLFCKCMGLCWLLWFIFRNYILWVHASGNSGTHSYCCFCYPILSFKVFTLSATSLSSCPFYLHFWTMKGSRVAAQIQSAKCLATENISLVAMVFLPGGPCSLSHRPESSCLDDAVLCLLAVSARWEGTGFRAQDYQ